MKKIAIVGASAVLAALPVVGVFAADPTSTSFTDNLSVTVDNGCTLENDETADGAYVDRSFSKNISVGNYAVLEGSQTTDSSDITIKCNTTSGTVTVSYAAANSAKLVGTTSSSNEIAAGAVTSGSNSGWAIKSNAENFTTDNFSAYTAPAASGTFLISQASANGTTFNPSYQVYVAQGQVSDTYTGSVTYTVSYAGA